VNDHPPFREDGRDWIVPGQNRPENIEGQTGGVPVEERLAWLCGCARILLARAWRHHRLG
jgi:hypothetical protein